MSARPPLNLVRDAFPDRPAIDTAALLRALLERVAEGDVPATLRIHRPRATVSFSKQDANAPGYARAVKAAGDAGFEAVERLAGGRAAVFHEDTVAIAWAVPAKRARESIHERFAEAADLIALALRGLGVDARVGEVPGEYCPGEFSVNARGQVKLAGLGQRLISGAAHTGGVLVAAGADRVREVLVPVYEALELPFEPSTAGSVADEVPGIGYEEVETALIEAFAERYDLVEAGIDAETMALAERLESRHRPEWRLSA